MSGTDIQRVYDRIGGIESRVDDLAASAILELVAHEGYIGPGSGLQTGPSASLDQLSRREREGDG